MTSTPHYPQSNGKAEATVKSMKKIISMCWNGQALDNNQLCRALLQYRNTPSRKDGLSPAQKLYGRPVQDTFPAHPRSFSSEWQRTMEDAEQKAKSTLEKSAEFYNLHSRSLPEIRAGSNVAIQNSSTKAMGHIWSSYPHWAPPPLLCQNKEQTSSGLESPFLAPSSPCIYSQPYFRPSPHTTPRPAHTEAVNPRQAPH